MHVTSPSLLRPFRVRLWFPESRRTLSLACFRTTPFWLSLSLANSAPWYDHLLAIALRAFIQYRAVAEETLSGSRYVNIEVRIPDSNLTYI
jgi:hypothetical protein